MASSRVKLQIIEAPRTGHVLQAPPTLIASDHSVDYVCGRCEAILLHADHDQVHGVLIHCKECGSYNKTGE
jgi:DNA-directed RNA polymerase subunit RPC12/RpoP